MAAAINPYTFAVQGQSQSVHPARAEEAAAIDADQDMHLSDTEIMDYLKRTDALEDPTDHSVDVGAVVEQYHSHLRKEIPAVAKHYHSYEQVGAELDRLQEAFPDKAVKFSLGQTPEGREIWGIRISTGARDTDTRNKPGIVITGCHHAREWMSMEAPLYLAGQLLENYDKDPAVKQRVDGAEITIVPLVNPDGYEYSRSEDNWWRKNRRPITDTGCSTVECSASAANPTYGVDLNRNYWDGKPEHFEMWRPASDKPCDTSDDFSWATSDNPRKDTYRGPMGASEPEVQHMLSYELGRGNIKGIIDHHGYGEMILFPWGVKNESVENEAQYREVGAKMNDSIADHGPKFRLMKSTELYPTSGGSHDIHHANGIMSFTLEIGKSFQPAQNLIDPIRKQVASANMTFIDQIMAANPAPPPPAPEPPAPQPPAQQPPAEPPVQQEGWGCLNPFG